MEPDDHRSPGSAISTLPDTGRGESHASALIALIPLLTLLCEEPLCHARRAALEGTLSGLSAVAMAVVVAVAVFRMPVCLDFLSATEGAVIGTPIITVDTGSRWN